MVIQDNKGAASVGSADVAKVVENWMKGGRVFVCEYRASKCETIEYRDKVSKEKVKTTFLRHTVEMGSESIQVSERVPSDFKAETYAAPFKKGQMVLWQVTGLATKLGATSGAGVLAAMPAPDLWEAFASRVSSSAAK